MANSKISQLPDSIAVTDSDLLAIVQDDSGTLSTNKITIADFKSGINFSAGAVTGADSGTQIVGGKVYLGGTPLLRDTTINQNGHYLKIDNGTFISTGFLGNSPVEGPGRRMMWIPEKGAFRAGQAGNTEWDNANLGQFSVAFGYNVKASGVLSFAAGIGVEATNEQAAAFGYYTKASGHNSFALGDNTESSGYNSVAMGIHTKAYGNSSFAFGDDTLATNYNSFAFGKGTQSTGQMAFAFGIGSGAHDTAAFAMGVGCLSVKPGAFALGAGSEAHAPSSVAAGGQSKAYGDCSFAIGNEAIAQGNVSISMGEGTQSVGNCSIAVGWLSRALKPQSSAFGSSTIADGNNSFVFGDQSKANGNNSFAGGYSSIADGISSFAFGASAWTKGFGSVAMGNTTVAEGDQSVALGYNNLAKGNSSFAAGAMSQATNEESIALGNAALSYGRQSVALGCEVQAGTIDGLNGMGAVALGDNAQALYDYSLSLGSFVKANAEGAFVIGKGSSTDFLINSSENSLAVGFGSPLATLYVGESPNTLSSGNVGIGTIVPLAKLHVAGNLMLETGSAVNKISTDNTLSGNSDTTLATEKAVKAYIDGLSTNVRRNKGGIDCSANPNYPAGTNGDTYQVTVAGKIGGASGISVDVNDEIICKANNAGGTQASVGSSWYVVEGNKDQATETTKGISKIATQALVTAGTNDTDYVTPLKLSTWFGAKTTANLTEGSNLYFTAARVLSTVLTGFTVPASAAVAATDSVLAAFGKLQAQINAHTTSIATKATLGGDAPTGIYRLGTSNAQSVTLRTNASDRLTIDTSGNIVQAGTTTLFDIVNLRVRDAGGTFLKALTSLVTGQLNIGEGFTEVNFAKPITNIKGTNSRMVEAAADGTMTASEEIVSYWIFNPTVQGLLSNTSNWSSKAYTGSSLSAYGLEMGMRYSDADYVYEMLNTTTPVRMARV